MSPVDIKVMALTYQLEVECNGHEHLKMEPTFNKSVVVGPKPPGVDKVEKVAGFFMPKLDQVEELADKVEATNLQSEEQGSDKEYQDVSSEGEESDPEEGEDSDDDDDEDGWITPANLQHVKNTMNGVVETVQLEVACLTTDFAMQVFEKYFEIFNFSSF